MRFLREPVPARGTVAEVVPGIRRMVAPNPGPMTYHGTNTYLIEMPGGLAVLDPGPEDAAHVRDVLAAAGSPITRILLTHTHRDHVGAVAALREATGAPLYAWHQPADPAGKPDFALQDGDAVGGWVAVHTPGHAPDHLCFFGPDGVAFSGDHVMGWSTTVVSPPSGDMGDYFRSLERLLACDAARYLPGHGPSIGDPGAHAAALLQHRRNREAAILAALGSTPQSVHALTMTVYPALDETLRRAAERSVTAHLLKLRADGAAAQSPMPSAAEGWVRAG